MNIKAWTFQISTTPKSKIGAVLSSVASNIEAAVNKNLKEVEAIGTFHSLIISQVDDQIVGTILYYPQKEESCTSEESTK